MTSTTFEFTIPKNTLDTAPLKQVNQYYFPKGPTSIIVEIPRGHQGLTGLRITASGNNLAPPGQGAGWIRGDSESKGPYKTDFSGPPWNLEFTGYNLDQSYPHTFFITLDS